MTDMTATAAAVRVEIDAGLAERTRPVLEALIRADVPTALMAKDPGVWGPSARPEAAGRLGWVDAAIPDPDLPGAVRALRERVTGLDRLVLVGIGGSSLAAEVVADAFGHELTVLDTTDCDQVAAVLRGPLDRTLIVVASKSGETVETRTVYEVLWGAMSRAHGAAAAAGHFVAVTDPGSVLGRSAAERGFPAFVADPTVGGRFSALTAFGLVPAGLLGADVAALGQDTAQLARPLGRPGENPGLLLGAALGAAALDGRDKLYLRPAQGFAPLFGAWAEQLVAESTGKDGRGILPVVDAALPERPGSDTVTGLVAGSPASPAPDADIRTYGSLGSQFLLWEYATAVAGRVLGINPFDQPNVQEAKDKTQAILAGRGSGAGLSGPDVRTFTEGAVEVGIDELSDRTLSGAGTLRDIMNGLATLLGPDGYLAVTAYLNRYEDAEVAALRELLARRTGRAVTFGWGPRYLHSSGQYHKGGPQHGVFLMITGEVEDDIPVPGSAHTLATIQRAQARGDLEILRGRGRPVVRIHLKERREGIRRLLQALTASGTERAEASR
ncbi:glucose-6-phosphate isomerase [Streptomyces griseochromogenes]|uniref:Glucose-6-phosphate isomerase n=1 Tax=Streptomyces griseochromogenes TaxID=68214 RepID=A0ABS4LKT9_9ACTN|nr:glucose-6-phosphate isomerase [Streptomyces griseochromogenes]MBP2047991.1 glucose-6-phosphate isomerase [Streptomyces griseochromogenes]